LGQLLLCGAMTNSESSDQTEPAKPEKEGWPLWGIVLLGTLLSFTVGYFLARRPSAPGGGERQLVKVVDLAAALHRLVRRA